MIIGNGMIGTALKSIDRTDVVFVAAGVSDSSCRDVGEFLREKTLIEKTIHNYPDLLLVFFSTFSIFDQTLSKTPYVNHKLEIEKLISKSCDNYLIVRLSNVVGINGNPKNVFNYFYSSIKNGINFKLWNNSTRNIIYIDDVVLILNHVLSNEFYSKDKRVYNIINAVNFSVNDIVKVIENHLGFNAHFDKINFRSVAGPVDEESKHRFLSLIPKCDCYISRILFALEKGV